MIRTTVTIAKSVAIKTTPEKVWEMLAADRLMEWQPYMARSETFEYLTPVESDEDKYKVGTTALFFDTCHHEIIQSEKFRKLVYRKFELTFLGMLEFQTAFKINPTEDGVRFSYIARFIIPKGIKHHLYINVFTKRWMESQIAKETKELKMLLERAEL